MTQLDSSIILQAGKPQTQDFATTLGQIGQLRAQQSQSQFQAAQLDQITRQNTIADADRATSLAAGQKYAAGDFGGAVNAAAAGGNLPLVKSLQEMNDTQRKRTFEISQQTAPSLLQLKTLAPELRGPALQHMAPQLIAAGLTPGHIASIDTSDQGLDAIGAGAQTIEQFVAQQNKNRDFKLETDKFGHTVAHDTATEGLTARGQNMTAATAARGQDISHADKVAELNKPVSVGFGNSLVNPATGKVAYDGMAAGQGNDAIAAQAKAIAEYRLAPPTGRAAVSGPGAAIMAQVAQLNPTYDGTRFHARNAAVTNFATGKLGNQTRSISVGIDHLDQVATAATALQNGNVKLFNGITQGIAAQTGGTAPTTFDALKDFVMDETTKAIVGSGGGVTDREKAQAILSRSGSPAQLAANIKAVQGLMAGQLHGLERQYKVSTGLDNFGDMVSPRARTVLGSAPTSATPPAAAGWSIKKLN